MLLRPARRAAGELDVWGFGTNLPDTLMAQRHLDH
jgi:hypothetical protein